MTRPSAFRNRVLFAASFLAAMALPSFAMPPASQASDAEVGLRRALPFAMPSAAELKASPRKVFAHYFPPFPISIDNKPSSSDYYATAFLSVDGERGKHASYGGYLRQRPLPRPPRTSPDWELEDAMTEIEAAAAIGIDGFTYDILGANDGFNKRLSLLLKAVPLRVPDFKIMLMPDMDAGFKTRPDDFFRLLENIHDDPSLFRTPDGRIVVSPYCPKAGTSSWWRENLARMDAKGIKVFFVPLFQAWWKYVDEFAPISGGFSDWGCGTPEEEALPARKLSPLRCHELGKLWFAPVRPHDFRPKTQMTFETAGASLYRAMWDTAISGKAEWVQIITWSDYGEASEIAPSTETQYGFYDLSAYFISWFKTGSPPRIDKDAIFYFHRIQPMHLIPEKQRKPFMVIGTPRDEIEALVFLKAPGMVEIRIAGKTYSKNFPGGLHSFKVPLEPGWPEFSISRDGRRIVELLSRRPVESKAAFQDHLYRSGSSLRPQLPVY